MNLRRVRWALLPLLAAAALAVLVLPPRPLPQRFVLGSYLLGFWTEDRSPDVERMHLRTLRVARERLRGEILVRAHGAADVRASREARALRSTRQPLVVVRDADVPDTTARRWLASAERELGFIPRASGTGVPVILALHTKHPQTDSGTVATFGPVVRYQYAARSDSACIVEVVFARRLEADRGRFDVPNGLKGDILGRCGLYARYGFPGPAVGRWAGLPSRWVARWISGPSAIVPCGKSYGKRNLECSSSALRPDCAVLLDRYLVCCGRYSALTGITPFPGIVACVASRT